MSFLADPALKFLDRAHQLGRLGHAYLVCGPRSAGLENFAVRFLNLVSGRTHPDLTAWENEGIPTLRPESKSRRINIGKPGENEGIRQMERQINLSANAGGHKFAVIVDAERMTEQAQAAFLKTLEEPPPGTLILLTSEHPEQFLETILSRVIRIQLMPEPGEHRLGEDERRLADMLSRLSHGKSPSRVSSALAIRREFGDILESIRGRIAEPLEEELEKEKKALKQTTGLTSQWVEKREEEMEAAIHALYLYERESLIELLLSWMGDVLRHQIGSDRLDLSEYAAATQALSRQWDAATVNRCIRELRRLSSHLHTNAQENLALDSAFVAAFA